MTQPLKLAKAALDKGNLILAHDIARAAIDEGDKSIELKHQLALALARMGDAEQVKELIGEYRLDQSSDAHHRAIGARILKDAALALPEGDERVSGLSAALDAYEKIYQESSDYYPGINAASLALLAGEKARAQRLAGALLELPEIAAPENYYAGATRAEALIILERFAEAGKAIALAGALPDAATGAKSSSYSQLALVADELGLAQADSNTLLAPILPPSVIHYCGHIFLSDGAVEKKLRKEIDAYLDQQDVAVAYGALAAGADIVIAEALLERGSELNIVFPFVQEDFVTQSITPGGLGWMSRFEKCLAAASSVTFATKMRYVGDPGQFGYASKIAMGMATLRAQYLGCPPQQLAIWDGNPSNGAAGTGADVNVWQTSGRETHIVGAEDLDRSLEHSANPRNDQHKRTVVAILFGDFPGFSKLPEAVLPAFWEVVMGRTAEILKKYAADIVAQNSWGDAIYSVTSSSPRAADLSLDLQAALQEIDYSKLGLGESSGMRFGVHYGPAYEIQDLITGRTNYYGTEVSRAARVEPISLPGAVFVTEPFAAILALEAPDRFKCHYIGYVELAKGYGAERIYRLTRSGSQ